MFSRIYIGIFLSLLLIAAANFMLYHWSWQERRSTYENEALEGVMRLISSELQRQPEQNRIRYLDIVAQLLGADVKIRTHQNLLNQRAFNPEKFKSGKNAMNLTRQRNRISWLLLLDNQKWVEVNIVELTEQQFRAHALLLVSELSRDNPSTLEQLRAYSAFPLKIALIEQLSLDAQQLSRLKRGGIVVEYRTETQATSPGSFNVYARLSETQALVLGPIPQLEPIPLQLVIIMLALSSFVIVIVAYWLVFQLEQRLKKVSAMVRAFGKGELHTRVRLNGKDSIAELGQHVDAMAARIENLLQNQRDMIQAVSHELRTPLARIRFRLEILDESTEPDISPKTGVIRKDLSELEQLIDEVLEHHKLTQLPELHKSGIDGFNLIERIIEQLQVLYPDITVDTNQLHFNEPVTLQAHEASLGRLLSNLIRNALKYAQKQVQIQLLPQTDGIMINIHDDGPGIPVKEREKVLEPFYQTDHSRSKQQGGYGLGLAIVKRIVDLHQGLLQIHDSPLGGACISIFFPNTTIHLPQPTLTAL